MKRLIAFFLCLICGSYLLTGCAKQPADNAVKAPLEFPGVSWGYSIEQVEDVYGELTVTQSSPTVDASKGYYNVTCETESELYGKPVKLLFGFLKKNGKSYLHSAEARVRGFESMKEAEDYTAEHFQSIFDNADPALSQKSVKDLTEEETKKLQKNLIKLGLEHLTDWKPMLFMEQYVGTDMSKPGRDEDMTPMATLNISAGFWCYTYLDFE